MSFKEKYNQDIKSISSFLSLQILAKKDWFQSHTSTKLFVENTLPAILKISESAALGLLAAWGTQKGVKYLQSFPAINDLFTKYVPQNATNALESKYFLCAVASLGAIIATAIVLHAVTKEKSSSNIKSEGKTHENITGSTLTCTAIAGISAAVCSPFCTAAK